MTAYYNDNDKYCAAVLRARIADGSLPAGDVDERDIQKVTPDDLKGYDQIHFFAGIGGWPLALGLAGWPDDRPVWTGSCPCQPLSSAGKRKGAADERHLWPAFYDLIAECRPATVFGEQVASKDGREWFSAVRVDLESLGYAVGGADLCAAGVGAPHIRQRLFWVATAGGAARERDARGISGAQAEIGGQDGAQHGDRSERSQHGGADGGLDNTPEPRCDGARQPGQATAPRHETRLPESGRRGDPDPGRLVDADGPGPRAGEQGAEAPRQGRTADPAGGPGGLGDAGGAGLSPCERQDLRGAGRRREGRAALQSGGSFWADHELIPCADGKARVVKPGICVLAHGVPGRVGQLRAYGNAIIPQLAAEFIGAYLEAM